MGKLMWGQGPLVSCKYHLNLAERGAEGLCTWGKTFNEIFFMHTHHSEPDKRTSLEIKTASYKEEERWSWLSSSVGWSIILMCQGCRFGSPVRAHAGSNQWMHAWTEQPTHVSFSLSHPLLFSKSINKKIFKLFKNRKSKSPVPAHTWTQRSFWKCALPPSKWNGSLERNMLLLTWSGLKIQLAQVFSCCWTHWISERKLCWTGYNGLSFSTFPGVQHIFQ